MSAVVVAEARNPLEAVLWVDALKAAGIRATSFERSVGPAMGGATALFASFPVLVPSDSIGAARSVIADIAGATRLSAYRDAGDARSRQTQAFGLVGAIVAFIVVAAIIARLLA